MDSQQTRIPVDTDNNEVTEKKGDERQCTDRME